MVGPIRSRSPKAHCPTAPSPSTLALLMTGIAANNVDDALAANYLAVFTDSFDAGTHFHDNCYAGISSKWGKVPQYTRYGPGFTRASGQYFALRGTSPADELRHHPKTVLSGRANMLSQATRIDYVMSLHSRLFSRFEHHVIQFLARGCSEHVGP